MDKNVQDFNDIVSNFSPKIKNSLMELPNEIKKEVQEICLRVNSSIVIITSQKSFFLGSEGNLSSEDLKSFIVSQNDILETFKILCNFSIYSFQNQIKNNFITLKGGHRVGICGTAIIDGEKIINISDISSMNFRISKEIIGCSDKIFEKLGLNLGGTLIVGPPASGKTTILRDIARKLSNTYENGKLIKVSIVDERREIAAVYQGVPQKDVGFSDILNGFIKSEGIMRALRTLSPRIIICDEIGNNEDADAIRKSLNCGVGIIASVHAGSAEEISKSEKIKNILNSGAIKNVVLLDKGKIKEIFEVEQN